MKQFKVYQLLLPVLIGFAVIGWMFYQEFDSQIFSSIEFSIRTFVCIILAFLFMFGRDLGLIWRYRIISDKSLTWTQAFRVNMLCEFTSAVTPSAIGGSSLAILFLNKEGINAGRSTTLMISTLFLDELFFILACAVVLFFIPIHQLFSTSTPLSSGLLILFSSVYGAVVLWTVILFIALFKRPVWIKKILLKLFRLPLLIRWYKQVEELTDNLVVSSKEISSRPFLFWAKAFCTTALSWSSRYLVANALFLAFSPANNQLLIFARQLILWITMIISPTPGGSGIGEYMFKEYYSDLFQNAGIVLVVTFLWRIISYYVYLLIGICIVPKWIKDI